MVNKLIPGEVIKSSHRPMITKEMFLKVNNLLHSREEGRKYNLDDENLPLKIFIKSTACGTPYISYVA